MKIDKEKTRKQLPKAVTQDFDDIVNQKVLGASSHIRMIGNMIEAIALEYQKEGAISEMKDRIHDVCTYFIATRGDASQAIINAIYQMIKGMDQNCDLENREEIVRSVIRVKNAYDEKNQQAILQAVEYAVEIGNTMNVILVYDYSSTVERFLRKLAPGKTILIAESRVINGGKPFIKACVEAQHKIHFIPDAGLMHFLKDCDGVFMGAETIYPDGTGFNTTGSDLVGLLCDYYQKPLYFISPLIKLDNRAVYGKEKPVVINDLKDKMISVLGMEYNEYDIDYCAPELVGVCPEHIRAYITEKGVIPSTQLYSIAMKYLEELRGEPNV